MNKPVYLDNNATTPTDPRVVDAMLPVLREHFGNPASSTHRHGWYAEELVQIAREDVASLIGALPEEIIFTSGATEANNIAIRGAVLAALTKTPQSAPHVISATTEHKAILDPLRAFSESQCHTKLLGVADDGRVGLEELGSALQPDTLLVSLMLGNNEIGVLSDIPALIGATRQTKALFHCDATQAVGKIAVDVRKLGVDALSFSAHKLYGPKGVGALFVRKGLRSAFSPLVFGGGHEQGLRSGTLNVPGIVGFGKACAICKKEQSKDEAHLKHLSSILWSSLKERIENISLNGSQEHRLPGNLNIAFTEVDNSRLLGDLSPKISVSATSACTSSSDKPSHVLAAIGASDEVQSSSIRIGIGRFNTEEEISFAADAICEAVAEQ